MIAELFLPCFIVQYMTSIYRLICLFDKIRGFDVSSWKLTQGEKEEIAINVIAHFIMCRLLVGKCCTKIKGFTVTIRWIDKNPHNTCYKRFMVVGENAPWKTVKIFVSQQKGNFQVESRYCYIVTSAIANTVCPGGAGDEKETSMYWISTKKLTTFTTATISTYEETDNPSFSHLYISISQNTIHLTSLIQDPVSAESQNPYC